MDTASIIDRRLQTCEYPFRWQLREKVAISDQSALEMLWKQLNEDSVLELQLPFAYYMIYVALAYQLERSQEPAKALKILRAGEEKFENALLEENNDNVANMSAAYLHILKATEAFLLKQMGDSDLALKVLPEIPALFEMNLDNITAVKHGFRAAFIAKFGPEGYKLALDCLAEAIDMNPNESLWYYMKAENLNRLKRDKDPSATSDSIFGPEIESIEKALQIKRCSIYTSHYAALKRKIANFEFYNLKELNSLDCLNEESYNLFCESIELAPDCPETMYRCARGFILLPGRFKDLDRAKQLLDKALKSYPDHNLGNLIMAQYYEKKKNFHQAIQHLKVCEKKKSFGAIMDLIRLEFQMGERIKVLLKLEDMLVTCKDDANKQIQILYELAAYHLFISKDLCKACEYVDQLMRFENLGLAYLQKRRSRCVFGKFELEKKLIYEILSDEIQRIGVWTAEERNCYNQFFASLQRIQNYAGRSTPPIQAALNWRINRTPSTAPAIKESLLGWRKLSQGPLTYKRATPYGNNLAVKTENGDYEVPSRVRATHYGNNLAVKTECGNYEVPSRVRATPYGNYLAGKTECGNYEVPSRVRTTPYGNNLAGKTECGDYEVPSRVRKISWRRKTGTTTTKLQI